LPEVPPHRHRQIANIKSRQLILVFPARMNRRPRGRADLRIPCILINFKTGTVTDERGGEKPSHHNRKNQRNQTVGQPARQSRSLSVRGGPVIAHDTAAVMVLDSNSAGGPESAAMDARSFLRCCLPLY